MDKDVLIKIIGLQVVGDEDDEIEVLTKGQHYFKNDQHYILYDEYEEETEEKIKNVIKFNANRAEVSREGFISAKLEFEKGKMNQTLYATPLGDILMEIKTKEIKLKEKDDNINLKIDYELYADSEKLSDSEIEIDINEA
ncbi:MAG: DUF1934 domain-containing protein [Eubacterium sp.]|nr:DUF1934 domain-containing protein [Eubacterium sp.]